MGKPRKPVFGSYDEDDTGYDLLGGALLGAAMLMAIALFIAVRSLG